MYLNKIHSITLILKIKILQLGAIHILRNAIFFIYVFFYLIEYYTFNFVAQRYVIYG